MNATGPYTDFVRELDDANSRKICQPSSGTHIVLPDYYRFCFYLLTSICFLLLFSRSTKLSTGLYILSSVISFFFSSFLMISQRQIIPGSAGPIFAIFSLNESVLGADDRSGPLCLISQWTLPWQPIL